MNGKVESCSNNQDESDVNQYLKELSEVSDWRSRRNVSVCQESGSLEPIALLECVQPGPRLPRRRSDVFQSHAVDGRQRQGELPAREMTIEPVGAKQTSSRRTDTSVFDHPNRTSATCRNIVLDLGLDDFQMSGRHLQ